MAASRRTTLSGSTARPDARQSISEKREPRWRVRVGSIAVLYLPPPPAAARPPSVPSRRLTSDGALQQGSPYPKVATPQELIIQDNGEVRELVGSRIRRHGAGQPGPRRNRQPGVG